MSAYWGAREFTEAIRVCDRLLQEFPQTRYGTSVRLTRALGLMHADRRDEGVAALEAAVKNEGARDDALIYSSALRTLHSYYMLEPRYIQGSREYQRKKGYPDYMRGITHRTKEGAARATELYELILQDLEGKQDVNSRMWAQSWVIQGTKASWITEGGTQRPLLSDEQREQLVVRALETFSWDPEIAYKAHIELSELSEGMGNWQQSIALLNLSACHGAFRNSVEARRYDKLIQSLPDVFWWPSSTYADWSPMRKSGASYTGTSHGLARTRLRK